MHNVLLRNILSATIRCSSGMYHVIDITTFFLCETLYVIDVQANVQDWDAISRQIPGEVNDSLH